MNPWDIIGWIIVAAIFVSVVLPIVGGLLVYTRNKVVTWVRHYQTYKTPPEAGQTWVRGRYRYRIDRIAENGRIVIRTGNSGWSHSPEEWSEMARRRDFYLAK